MAEEMNFAQQAKSSILYYGLLRVARVGLFKKGGVTCHRYNTGFFQNLQPFRLKKKRNYINSVFAWGNCRNADCYYHSNGP